MKPETAEKLLVWILRGAGVVCVLAIAPMLMPIAWAQSAHAAIGLGELPGEPIVEYLVRGMSAMCALYGWAAAAFGNRCAPVSPGHHFSGRRHSDSGHLRDNPHVQPARPREIHPHRRSQLLALLRPHPLAAKQTEKGVGNASSSPGRHHPDLDRPWRADRNQNGFPSRNGNPVPKPRRRLAKERRVGFFQNPAGSRKRQGARQEPQKHFRQQRHLHTNPQPCQVVQGH